jgi:hypothetical protein
MTDTLRNSTINFRLNGEDYFNLELPGVLVDPKEHRLLQLWESLTDDLVSSMPTGMEDLFDGHPDWEEYKELSGWE